MLFRNNNLLSVILSGLLVLTSQNMAAQESEVVKNFSKKEELFFSHIFSTRRGGVVKEEQPLVIGLFTSDWKRYDYANSGFSIELPSEPDYSKQTIEIPQSDISIKYETFVVEPNEDLVYVISVWNYPEKIDIGRPELNLQEGFSGMLSALPDSHVLFMQSATHQGHQSLEFWIRNEDIYFRGKLISVNHTLYQVFMVYKSDNAKALDKEYEKFAGSFNITRKKGTARPSSSGKKTAM